MFLCRAENHIRHCRFAEENNQFTIGSATFDSMTELITYYEHNPLYRKMKLKYAINDEILKQIGEVQSIIHAQFAFTPSLSLMCSFTLFNLTLYSNHIICFTSISIFLLGTREPHLSSNILHLQ